MRFRHGLALLFVVESVACGFVYWWQADWWVYLDKTATGGGMEPKFKLTLAEQFVISSVVGTFLGGVLTGVTFLASRAWAAWGASKKKGAG
jgi:hypothetical protein